MISGITFHITVQSANMWYEHNFLISDRYDVKYVEISWYNMEGRMAGRWISVDSRQSEVFIQKIEFSTSRYIIMCIAPPDPPLHALSFIFVYNIPYLFNV